MSSISTVLAQQKQNTAQSASPKGPHNPSSIEIGRSSIRFPPHLRKCENSPMEFAGRGNKNTTATARTRVVTPSDINDNPSPVDLTTSQFAKRALIPKWGNIYETLPTKFDSYNNDLYIESYPKSKYHFPDLDGSVFSKASLTRSIVTTT